MHSRLFVLVLLCFAIACSASETANHSIRCDSNSLCPNQMVCYRDFCIPDDQLTSFDLDASAAVIEPVAAQDAGRQEDIATGSTTSPLDAASSGEDAAPVATPTEDAQVMVPPAVPDAEVPVTTEPTPPAVPPDAGKPASDAGRPVNSSALLICVPSCSNRSPTCWLCLNGVLDANPGICSQSNRADPLSSGLCDFLCATAACRGES